MSPGVPAPDAELAISPSGSLIFTSPQQWAFCALLLTLSVSLLCVFISLSTLLQFPSAVANLPPGQSGAVVNKRGDTVRWAARCSTMILVWDLVKFNPANPQHLEWELIRNAEGTKGGVVGVGARTHTWRKHKAWALPFECTGEMALPTIRSRICRWAAACQRRVCARVLKQSSTCCNKRARSHLLCYPCVCWVRMCGCVCFAIKAPLPASARCPLAQLCFFGCHPHWNTAAAAIDSTASFPFPKVPLPLLVSLSSVV